MASNERAARRERAKGGVLVRWAQVLIRFFLAATLAGGQWMSRASPFGVALVGASGAGGEGFAALAGAVCGYLLSQGPEEGLRCAACGILVFSVAFAFFDAALCKKRAFMPLVTGGLYLLTGLVTVPGSLSSSASVAGLVSEGAVCVLGTVAFREAFSLWDSGETARPGARQRLGLMVLALAVLLSLAGLELPGAVSVGRLCAGVAGLTAGWAAGPGAGAAVGLTAGLAMDLSGGGESWAVSCALAALAAGLLRGRRRGAAAAGAAVAGAAMAVWRGGGMSLSGLPESLCAALLFLLIPQRLLDRARPLLAPEVRPDRAQWASRAASRRLQQTADAFEQVFSALRSAFERSPDNGEDPSVIYDRCANRVCAGCPMRERCWQREYQDTYDLLNASLGPMLERRQARAEDFPQRFRDRCCRFPAFLTAAGEELSAHLLRRRYRRQVDRSRRAVCGQYGDMARLLQDAAAAMAAPVAVDSARTRRLRQFLAGRELDCQGVVFTDPQGRLQLQLEGEDAPALAGDDGQQALSDVMELALAPATLADGQVLFRQQEPLTALAGAAGRKRRGQSVSGDAFTWFKTPSGTLFILLCDGMGSGPQARQESELCIKLLEKFLRAGVTASNALQTLDQALALREEETGGFSTVDLLELDLYSGQGTLWKLGAAPSYLRQGGTVKCLTARSLPAGLTGPSPDKPDRLAFQVGPGDCLALLTDGVTGEEDGWLRDALSRFDGDSPAALAEALVGRDEDDLDDKTALVLRIGLRTLPGMAEL